MTLRAGDIAGLISALTAFLALIVAVIAHHVKSQRKRKR
jgi:hypothetical protein